MSDKPRGTARPISEVNGPADNLDRFEVNLVISYFMYYMSMEQRHDFMSRFPDIYNRLCGSEIMKAMRVKDYDEKVKLVDEAHQRDAVRMYKALSVIYKDPKISKFLKDEDPAALTQVLDAMSVHPQESNDE